jgi:superfamily I DNA/RNA helicase
VKDDTDFLKQPEIKTALAYLYIINNISHPIARGTEAWWRIFHYNNALSQEDSIRIGEHLKKKWVTFQEAIYHHIGELGLSKSGLETISNVKKRIDSLCSKTNLDVSDLILEVYDQSGLSMQFSHTDTKHSREALDFKELIDYKTGKSEPGPDERSKQLLLYARGIEHVYPQYKVKRLTLEQLGLPNPRAFELKGGKFESTGSSRMEGLDEDAIEDMIEIAKKIAHDYECGFGRTKDEKVCEECGYRLYCGD